MPTLLDPLEVKGITLKNRIVMPPMQTGFATPEGGATDAIIDYYVQRAESVGLIIVEHSYVSLTGQLTDNQLGIYDDKLIDGLKVLTSRIHDQGTICVIQLNHAGAKVPETSGIQPVAPSPYKSARALTEEELEILTYSFARAAERAMKAGFDGVEIHGAHGFLLNQFFSPITNFRKDKYGGPLANRMRLPLEVVYHVRKQVDGLLLYRLGSDDMSPKGNTIDDSKPFAQQLEKAGVDVIDVSGGMCGSRPSNLESKQGYFITQATQIKKVVNVPVIGVGGIKDAKFADKLIRQGQVDLVAVGRALKKDPRWAAKAITTL